MGQKWKNLPRSKNVVWLEVSRDKYKLPIAVADSAAELAEITGANLSTIETTASKALRGIRGEGKYVKVYLEEDDENE